jgi:hypothetical protein
MLYYYKSKCNIIIKSKSYIIMLYYYIFIIISKYNIIMLYYNVIL